VEGHAEGPKDRRRFGRRRFGRGPAQAGQPQAQEQEGLAAEPVDEGMPKPEPVACPICGKPVYDLSTALSADREHPVPSHFDCILERVTAAEALGPNERVVYLGSGAFGVVEFKDKAESSFVVKRRIQWEKEGEKQDWRKGLSSRISNL
jgi:hypothetical protein